MARHFLQIEFARNWVWIILSLVATNTALYSTVFAQEQTRLLAVHKNSRGAQWTADLIVSGNTVSGFLSGIYQNQKVDKIPCKAAKIKNDSTFKTYCKTGNSRHRSLKGSTNQAKLSAHGRAGGAVFSFIRGDQIEEFLALVERGEIATTDEFLQRKSN